MNAGRKIFNSFPKRRTFSLYKQTRTCSTNATLSHTQLQQSAALINSDQENMKYFLAQLNSESLTELRENVAEFEAFQDKTLPTKRQLFLTALHAGIPFIGFGFLDNFLMILWGEAIEYQFGIYGFSIMAAAAIGNTVSDCGGVFCAEYIEHQARRFNIERAQLSPWQERLAIVRIYNSLGSVVGVIIGCILGAFPLLFLDNENFNIARKAFAYTNKAHEGCIAPQDLQQFFAGINLNLTEEQVVEFISEHDHNGDGSLDENEFIELFQKAMDPKHFATN